MPPTSRCAPSARSVSTMCGGLTDERPHLPNCDDGLSKTLWVEQGWQQEPAAREELFDLVFDPNESRNLAGDPSRQTALADMRARLDRWMKETADPLLEGPLQPPKGARINDPDGRSPRETPKVVD